MCALGCHGRDCIADLVGEGRALAVLRLISSMVWPCFAARVPIAVAMLPDPLFRDQGINCTGMDQLCAVAGVSKRTLYQHFTGKDELIAEHLRRFDPDILPEVFDRADLTPRARLLAAFDIHSPLCPFIGTAVEIPDPDHPARTYRR